MIYTINLNPALDHYLSFNNFNEGMLNNPIEDYKLPGGKGINVSKVLKNYGISSCCMGFLGGFTGTFIENKIEEYGITQKFIRIPEDSRINIKLNNNGIETEISGISPKISLENYNEFLNLIKTTIKENDILVLSGSVPSSLSHKIYKEIIQLVPENVQIILDTRGESLKEAISKKIFLVKPNKVELEEFFQEQFISTKDLIRAGKKLQKLGPKNVLISLGKDGSILITENEIYYGNVPKGNLISSVGAGDSMVAGFIYGLAKNLPILDIYKFSIASGSATAFSKGLSTLDFATTLTSDITITKLEVI